MVALTRQRRAGYASVATAVRVDEAANTLVLMKVNNRVPSLSLSMLVVMATLHSFLVLRRILDGRGRGRGRYVKKDGNATFDKRSRHFGHRACRVVVYI